MNKSDFLVCGTCQMTFMLNEMIAFMNHKRFDCDPSFSNSTNEKILRCTSCSKMFETAYSLLKHAQTSHGFQLFQVDTNSSNKESGNNEFSSNNDVSKDSKFLEETIKSLVSLGNISEMNANNAIHTSNESVAENEELKLLSEVATESSTSSLINKISDSSCKNSSCADLCLCPAESCRKDETDTCCRPLVCGPPPTSQEDSMSSEIEKNDCEINDCKCEKTENCSCDTGGFGIVLQKCCNSIIPKKRQRHMTLKHLQFDKQNRNGKQHSVIIPPHSSISIPTTFSNSNSNANNNQSSNTSVTINLDNSAKSSIGSMRRYPTTKPYKCIDCGQSFNQRIHLKKHQSKHTGIKPFQCSECSYATVERSHLKVHIRVHTGEKPYKCTFCSYATSQNSTLKLHTKRKHKSTKASSKSITATDTSLNSS